MTSLAAVVRTPLAGDFVTAQCRLYFEEQGVEIVPPYLIAAKVRRSITQYTLVHYICASVYSSILCMLSSQCRMQ